MPRPRPLAPPRVSRIALPRLIDGDLDAAYEDRHDGERLAFAGRRAVDLALRTLSEVELVDLRLHSLDTAGGRFADVTATDLDVVEWHSHDASWRNVDLSGGRIGSLDLSDAELNSVRLADLRIGHLDLRAAVLQDVLVERCVIGSLDLPSARITRVAFVDSRAGELDLRMIESTELDIRGLEIADRLEIGRASRPPLEGVHASAAQLTALAPVLARHAGLTLEPRPSPP